MFGGLPDKQYVLQWKGLNIFRAGNYPRVDIHKKITILNIL